MPVKYTWPLHRRHGECNDRLLDISASKNNTVMWAGLSLKPPQSRTWGPGDQRLTSGAVLSLPQEGHGCSNTSPVGAHHCPCRAPSWAGSPRGQTWENQVDLGQEVEKDKKPKSCQGVWGAEWIQELIKMFKLYTKMTEKGVMSS